jgi:hypothetical protein
VSALESQLKWLENFSMTEGNEKTMAMIAALTVQTTRHLAAY